METKKEKRVMGIQKRSIYSLLGFIGLSVFNFFQFKYWIIPNLQKLFKKDLVLSYPEFFEIFWSELSCYISIALSIILFFSIFKKLKKYSEGGLIYWLIFVFIFGLTFWLACVLTFGIGEPPVGLTFGAGELLVGLICGLSNEFKSSKKK